MPGQKDNNNNNDKTRNNDARQQQLREERARRRQEAGNEDAAPVFGTQRLFAEPRRGANAPVDVNVDELFTSPAAVQPSSSMPSANVITPRQVEEALAIASATALPDDDDDDLLLEDDGGVDVSDAVLSYDESEGQMDIDPDDSQVAPPVPGNGTLRVHVQPKAGEVVVEDVRDWTAACQKDGSTPSSVRDIGIQADFGGASIERHRRYLRASRNRQRKRNLAKKRAMAGDTAQPPLTLWLLLLQAFASPVAPPQPRSLPPLPSVLRRLLEWTGNRSCLWRTTAGIEEASHRRR